MTKTNLEIEEALRKEFQFDGVTYKGQRHWKDDVKYGLVAKFIETLLQQRMDEIEEVIKDHFYPEYTTDFKKLYGCGPHLKFKKAIEKLNIIKSVDKNKNND